MNLSEMNDFKKDLFLKSIDIRNSIIKNIDDQILQIKQVCVGLVTVFIGFCLSNKNYHLIYFSAIIVLLFWIIEALVKKNQRGYIIITNEIQKAFRSNKIKTTSKEFAMVIDNYYFDLNGYYTLRKSADVDTIKRYKRDTSLFRILFYKNVAGFYLIIFFLLGFLTIFIRLI